MRSKSLKNSHNLYWFQVRCVWWSYFTIPPRQVTLLYHNLSLDEALVGGIMRGAFPSPDATWCHLRAIDILSRSYTLIQWSAFPLFWIFRVFESSVFMESDSGYRKDMGITTSWQTLEISLSVTPLGKLYQSLPSPIPWELVIGKRSQSPVLRTRT